MQRTIFRPSIVLGDSRRPETNQFEMVRAFVFLAGLPVLPFRPTDQIDIVKVDFVAGAVAMLHQKPNPAHEIYHLSSGTDSETFSQLTDALAKATGKRGPDVRAEPRGIVIEDGECAGGKAGKIGGLANLLKVFLPYLVWNTVFDNKRASRSWASNRPRFRNTAIRCCASAAKIILCINTAIGRRTAAEMQAARHGERRQDQGQ